jgi:type VII secretion protein EccB
MTTQTQKDQLQAHSFLVSRLRSALLSHDPDALETPTRRFSVGAFAGVCIAVLILAGVGVYGLIRPGGNTAWREAGTVLREKETGTRYLYDGTVLRPVANFASARLLVRSGESIMSVSSNSLRGVGHGRPVGIPGAPDTLPEASRLGTTPWEVCSDGTSTAVLVGATDTSRDLGQDVAFRVDAPDRGTYLVWHGQRLRVADRAASVALGIDRVGRTPVTNTWLKTLKQGPDLRAPVVAHRGAAGPALASFTTRVGQVLRVEGMGASGPDYRLVLPGGLAPVTPIVAALVLTDPGSSVAYAGKAAHEVRVDAGTVASLPSAVFTGSPDAYPSSPPRLADAEQVRDGALCVSQTGGKPSDGTRVGLREVTWEESSVVVPGGRGALVREAGGSKQLHVVTDWGTQYPIVSEEAAEQLGYDASKAATVSRSLLALLPPGPVLDPAAAVRVVR